MSRARKIVKDTFALSGAGLFGQVLAVVQSFVTMRLLDPRALGPWLAAVLVLGYTAYSHLGLDNGLALRLPHYRGRRQPERARILADSVFTVWTSAAVVLGLAVALYALLTPHSGVLRTGLLVVAAIVPLAQQASFLGRWQTSIPVDFTLGSVLSVAQSLLSFLLVVPLVFLFGVYGLMVGTLAVAVIILGLWWWRTDYVPRLRISRKLLVEGYAIGVPLLASSIGTALVQTADRLVIVAMLGAASLGYYAVTGMGGNIAYGLMSYAANALSPHIVEAGGRTRHDPATMARYLVGPTIALAAVAAALILGVVEFLPPFVRAFLPRYIPGLPAFYAFVPGFFFLGITLNAGNVLAVQLVARGQQWRMVAIQFTAIAVEAAGAFLLIRSGLGLLGAALASTLAYVVTAIGIVGYAAALVLPARERVAFFGRVLLPLGYAGAVGSLSVWVGSRIPDGQLLLRLAAQAAIFVLAFIPLAWWLLRYAARLMAWGGLPRLRRRAPRRPGFSSTRDAFATVDDGPVVRPLPR